MPNPAANQGSFSNTFLDVHVLLHFFIYFDECRNQDVVLLVLHHQGPVLAAPWRPASSLLPLSGIAKRQHVVVGLLQELIAWPSLGLLDLVATTRELGMISM